MRRTKVQSGYFSMITPARGTRELKWKTTHTTNSTSSNSGSSETGGGGGGADPCILGICFTLPGL
jgi:hypothetical protein